MNLIIKKLNAEILPDYVHFMEEVAFADNPDWSKCFCCCYHVDDTDTWMKRKKAENKRDCQLWAESGQLSGLLVYNDEGPIAWCNVNAKRHYKHILGWEGFPDEDDEYTGSIVCFIVSHHYRGNGIASLLMKEALKHLTQEGYKYAEGYPKPIMEGDAENFHGTLSMYEKIGFKKIRDASHNTMIMRKSLS